MLKEAHRHTRSFLCVIHDVVLVNIFEKRGFLFFERFDNLNRSEVWSMFHALTPLKETRAYREILAEGEARGEATYKCRFLYKIHNIQIFAKNDGVVSL